MKLNRRYRSEFGELVSRYGGTSTDKAQAYWHAQGYNGTMWDMESQWLTGLSIPPSVGTMGDRERLFLSSEGSTITGKVAKRRRILKWWEGHALMFSVAA